MMSEFFHFCGSAKNPIWSESGDTAGFPKTVDVADGSNLASSDWVFFLIFSFFSLLGPYFGVVYVTGTLN